jgi:hypothetical protein
MAPARRAPTSRTRHELSLHSEPFLWWKREAATALLEGCLVERNTMDDTVVQRRAKRGSRMAQRVRPGWKGGRGRMHLDAGSAACEKESARRLGVKNPYCS